MNPSDDERRYRYEGWRVVSASGLGAFCTSAFVFTFTVLLRPLSEEFGWSRETISSAFGCMTLSVALAAPLTGYLVDRTGPRWIVGPSLLTAACAFGSLALLTADPWHLYGTYIVIGIASSGTSPVVYSRVVSSWFDRRRGVALAAVIASMGAGAIVHPAAAQALIRSQGWRSACAILALLVAAVGVPIVAHFVREPERLMSAAGPASSANVFGGALRSRIYWTLLFVVFGSTIAMNGVIVHLSALLTDRGIAASNAVIAISAMGAASLAGRLLTGWLLDRFVATRVSFALLTIAAGGILLLINAHTLANGVIAAVLIGFGTGGEVDVTPYLLSRYFGIRSLSTLYGITWMAFGLAGVAGPVLMGRAFDSTGSYDRVLLGFAGLTFAAAGLMLTLPAHQSARVIPQHVSL
jgi:MFS family permease